MRWLSKTWRGGGAKSSVCPSKPGKPNFLGGISRDFAGTSQSRPKTKSLRKKARVQFLALKTHEHKQICGIVPGLGGCRKVVCVCVFFFGSFLMGEKKTHKQIPPKIPGQSRENIVNVFPSFCAVFAANGSTSAETGRIRFRRARLQTPDSASCLVLTELCGENSVSSSRPIICVCVCATASSPNFAQSSPSFVAELSEFCLPKQQSRNSIPLVFEGQKRTPKPKNRTNGPKNFLNNSRALPNKTRVLRRIAPESSPESSARSLSQKFFGVPFLFLMFPTSASLAETTGAIGSMTRLKEMLFGTNQLVGKIPDAMVFMRSLTVLQIETNRMSGTSSLRAQSCGIFLAKNSCEKRVWSPELGASLKITLR